MGFSVATMRSWLSLIGIVLVCVSAQPDIFDAVRNDDAAAIAEALNQGADVNAINPSGLQTPLMLAVLHGKEEAVKVLLEHSGVDVTIPEKDGYTPMHGAGFQGRAEIAKRLIEHGVDPNHMHADGYTPLHRACWGREQRHTDTVQVFLDAGVPFDYPSASGKLPVDMAAMKNPATAKLLRERADAANEL